VVVTCSLCREPVHGISGWTWYNWSTHQQRHL
jgi:hypothetical protein